MLSKLAVKRYTAVNGQVLESPENTVSTSNIVFQSPNKVSAVGEAIDFTKTFKSGDTITITTNTVPRSWKIREGEESARSYNLEGTYTVSNINGNAFSLVTPETVNANWVSFGEDGIDWTLGVAGSIKAPSDFEQWEGPFYIDDPDSDGVMINFVAPNGIYTVHPDGDKFAPFDVAMEVKFEALNEDNDPIAGSTVLEYRKIAGRGATLNAAGTIFQMTTDDEARRSAAATHFFYRSGRQRVWIRRFSKENVPNPPQQYFEEVRIKDLYSYQLIISNKAAAANTTRVYVKTIATEGALSLKERKLRLLVQRYVTDATSGLPKLSNRADDILRHIATDPKIGNLQLTQVDIAQIKAEIDAQIAYFSTDKCSEFCGTFDDNNLSAEETMQIVAKAVFSQAKRQGNKIMLDFERKVPASVAVFNSHNIIPESFAAPQSLGIANDYDGVKIEYTDPMDDAIITMTYPNDAITNPHEDKLIGVRNKVQAHTHMMRMYNKDRHAYKSCEFVAGDESNIVVRTNRITVADQLRADLQQGSVDSIETIGGDIVLHTTDPVTIEPSVPHTMFIQTINNGVESIAVTARDDYSVKLARLPSGEISGTDRVVQAVYQIVSETDDNRDAYLVAQKDPSDGMTNKLLCTNYDDRYYKNDSDFTNGLIVVEPPVVPPVVEPPDEGGGEGGTTYPDYTGLGLPNEFNKTIATSGTLVAGINQLRDNGWQIIRNTTFGSFSDKGLRIISLDGYTLNSNDRTFNTLAHEVGHAIYTGVHRTWSREAFIDDYLKDEGYATMYHIKVVREAQSVLGYDIGRSDIRIFYDDYDLYGFTEEGYSKIGTYYGDNYQTSTSGELYKDYYGNLYDRYHAQAD